MATFSGKRNLLETTPISASAEFSFDYRAIKRSPRNKWTVEQRITLCTLLQFYELDGLETMLIFNSLFAKELPTSTGLSRAALASMHYKLQHENFQHSGSWITIRKTIEAEAVNLGIHLSPKKSINETESSQAMDNDNLISVAPDFSSNGEALDNMDWPSDSDGTLLGDDIEVPQTPCQSRGRPLLEKSLKIPGLMSSGSFKSLAGQGVKRSKHTPRLAYRA